MSNDVRDQMAVVVYQAPTFAGTSQQAEAVADALLPIVRAYAAQMLHGVADAACKRNGIPDTVLGADIRARAYDLDPE